MILIKCGLGSDYNYHMLIIFPKLRLLFGLSNDLNFFHSLKTKYISFFSYNISVVIIIIIFFVTFYQPQIYQEHACGRILITEIFGRRLINKLLKVIKHAERWANFYE